MKKAGVKFLNRFDSYLNIPHGETMERTTNIHEVHQRHLEEMMKNNAKVSYNAKQTDCKQFKLGKIIIENVKTIHN